MIKIALQFKMNLYTLNTNLHINERMSLKIKPSFNNLILCLSNVAYLIPITTCLNNNDMNTFFILSVLFVFNLIVNITSCNENIRKSIESTTIVSVLLRLSYMYTVKYGYNTDQISNHKNKILMFIVILTMSFISRLCRKDKTSKSFGTVSIGCATCGALIVLNDVLKEIIYV